MRLANNGIQCLVRRYRFERRRRRDPHADQERPLMALDRIKNDDERERGERDGEAMKLVLYGPDNRIIRKPPMGFQDSPTKAIGNPANERQDVGR